MMILRLGLMMFKVYLIAGLVGTKMEKNSSEGHIFVFFWIEVKVKG